MSNTRRALPYGPLRQERYCSSPQLERGLMANLVAKRSEVILDKTDREMIWFLQYLSHLKGGLNKVAMDLKGNWSEQLLVEICLNPKLRVGADPALVKALLVYRQN